jgi:hypothetical protein
MTGRADFTQEEWELVLEGPPSAGMIVVTGLVVSRSSRLRGSAE